MHAACCFLEAFCRGRCMQPGLLGCLLGERGWYSFLRRPRSVGIPGRWASVRSCDAMPFPLEPLPAFWDSASWPLKGEWTNAAGGVDGLGVTDATSAAEGRCNKRSALRSPLQCAVKPVAACCVGLCTALLHFAQNHVVRLGAQPTALHSRFPVIGNRLSFPWPILPACLLSGLCNACRLLPLSLLLRKSPQDNLLSPGG